MYNIPNENEQKIMIKELISYSDGDYQEKWKWCHLFPDKCNINSYQKWFIIETNENTKKFIMQSSRTEHNPETFECLVVDIDLKEMEPTAFFYIGPYVHLDGRFGWALWRTDLNHKDRIVEMWKFIELLIKKLEKTNRKVIRYV